MKKHKPYKEYRDSQTLWIGKIPKHWEIVRLKYLVRIRKDIANSLGYDVLSITQKGIKVKDVISGGGQLSMDYSKYQKINKGEFGMNHMDLLTGYVDISKYDGVISPDYRVFEKINTKCSDSYLLNIFQFCYTNKVFYGFGKGVSQFGRWRLPAEEFVNFRFPLPPLSEQQSIADFLDYKTKKIDRLIAYKKKQIKLLNEQKAGIINQAVTRGLNPNAPTKASGTDWLGEIPKHWEVKRLKYVAKIKTGRTPKIESSSKDYFKNGNINWYTPGDFSQNGILNNSRRKINELAIIDCQVDCLDKDSVYLVSIGGTIGKVGISTQISSCNQQINAIVFNKFTHPMFGYFYLKSQLSQIKLLADYTTLPILNQSQAKEIIFLAPPFTEQQTIVSYIKKEIKQIDETITNIEEEIKLVQELRTSLIAEAVTGKIDVSNYVVPQELELDEDEELDEDVLDEEIEMEEE